MKKQYLSPCLKVVCIETPELILLAGSGPGPDIDISVDGSDNEITEGGTTKPDENYNPW